jgi:hypothetical protein
MRKARGEFAGATLHMFGQSEEEGLDEKESPQAIAQGEETVHRRVAFHTQPLFS